MVTILVCEDQPLQLEILATKLQAEGYRVLTAHNGQEAMACLDKQAIDLIITDVMMPLMDGLSLAKGVRARGWQGPLLMLTAKSQLGDLEAGFGAGADDYMTKPFELRELLLRVGALLRRAKINDQEEIKIGPTRLVLNEYKLYHGEETIDLQPKEFQVLYQLLSYPNRIFTRVDLLDALWGMDAQVEDRVVDACVKKIRKKLEGIETLSIETVRGVGYKGEIHED